MHNRRMPRICALITTCGHTSTQLQHCIELLNRQQLKPSDIIIAGCTTDAEQVRSSIPLHTLPAETGTAACRAKGMQKAFEELMANYVWELEADSAPDETCLQTLLEAMDKEDKVCLPLSINPKGNLAFPVFVQHRGKTKLIANTAELPHAPQTELAHALPGGLYPRAAWLHVGVPNPELIMQGEWEEYAVRLRAAGFKLYLVPHATLRYSETNDYLFYNVGDEPFAYRLGKTLEQHYYIMRNRAWTDRLKRRTNYLGRLISCGFYMLNTLCAMLQSGEFSLKRAYLVFRGQHNGFYGKLRPY